MTQRNLAAVLLKVLGVYCIILAVGSTAPLIGSLRFVGTGAFASGGPEAIWQFGAFLIGPLTHIFMAYLLIAHGEDIAYRIFPEPKTIGAEAVPAIHEWYVLACVLLGILLVVWYVPDGILRCVYDFTYVAKHGSESPDRQFGADRWEVLTRTIMQLALGLLLIFGARNIGRFVVRLRGK